MCNNVYRVGLEPVANYAACYEKALGSAVQSVNKLQLCVVRPRVTLATSEVSRPLTTKFCPFVSNVTVPATPAAYPVQTARTPVGSYWIS